jgi:predicted ATP-grasp superfamily ATP-dependent carboligase
MRIDDRDNSIKVTECNPRFGTSTYMSIFSGINFPYLGILMTEDKIIDIDYKEIRYLRFKSLIYEILKNMSLKDVNKHNLYFIRQVIYDPLYYGYSMNYYLFLILFEKLSFNAKGVFYLLFMLSFICIFYILVYAD